MSRKLINSILFVIFILFAVLQLNDPDPIIWVLVYGIVAFMCLYSNFRVIPRTILIVVTILLLGYALFHLSLFITYLQTDNKEEIFGEMVYEKPYLEGSREFFGLVIAAFAILYQLKGSKKAKK